MKNSSFLALSVFLFGLHQKQGIPWICFAFAPSLFTFRRGQQSFPVSSLDGHARRKTLKDSNSLFATGTLSSSTITASANGVSIDVAPRIWNFKGHECYAEVAKPSSASSFMIPFSSSTSKNPEIVLIHGFGCSTVYWRETIRALTQAGYVVHALDLLGQGKSSKPGRNEGIEYSINLWAELVDSYIQQFVKGKNGVVLMGNSLGSVVALAAATGDYCKTTATASSLATQIRGVGMYNCGIGMNSRNIVKEPTWNPIQRAVLTALFDLFDALIFGNISLLTYVLDEVVTKDLLRNALVGLYQCAPDPESRVNDALVDSFYLPAKDKGSVEALSQIYTNDAGKTPMELHDDYQEFLQQLPIHLVWGTKDTVTPLTGSVGQFYSALANSDDYFTTMTVLEAGHIPFDEIPECNDAMVRWLEERVVKRNPQQQQKLRPNSPKPKPIFQWPFA